LDLRNRLERYSVYSVFHPSYLRMYVPNNDRLFTGRFETQLTKLEDRMEND
ncbi:hypothetical protein BDR04DRAFT_1037691, partial [Suillus decipiens]